MMANKGDGTASGGASRRSGFEHLRQIVADSVGELCEKANRQAAALRLEVNALSARLEAIANENRELKEENRRTMALVKVLAVEKVVMAEKARLSEKAYRKFFSGDSGLLYRLGYILSAFSQLSRNDSPDANDMLRAFSHFINLANNLAVLDFELSRAEQGAVEVPDMSADDLLRHIAADGDLDGLRDFYTSLWQRCEAPLRRLCDQNRDETFGRPGAYAALMADVRELFADLRAGGIAVIPSVSAGYDTLFDNAGADDVASRPLVMRRPDSFVYTRGLYNKLKPYTPWE